MNWIWFLFSFKGRITRKPYWFFMLVTIVAGFILYTLLLFSESIDSDLYLGGFVLLLFWPIMAVHAKRWHDRGRSAWWFLVTVNPLPGPAYLVAIWVLIECTFMPGAPQDNRFGPSPGDSLESEGKADRFQPVLTSLLIGFILAIYCFPRYRIPSGAMMPTLLVGDFIVGSRVTYGIPMPFMLRELMSVNDPVRGDVIIYQFPPDISYIFIKRVVGEPGDRIAYIDKELYINGEHIRQTNVGKYTGGVPITRKTGVLQKLERLGDVEYYILIDSEKPNYVPGCTEMEGHEILVPDGHYFVMGDNRDYSNDSRCWGFVPRANVIGKPLFVWFAWDVQKKGISYSRLGRQIQ